MVPPARRPTSRLRALLLTVVVGVAACIAPTLPVPPPSQPEVSSPDSSGMVTVKGDKGGATPGAQLTVWNQTYAASAPECRVGGSACDAGVVTVVHDDGSYLAVIKGQSRDVLDLWQTVGTGTSAQTEVRVP